MKAAVNIALVSAVSILSVIGIFSYSIANQAHSVVKGLQERNIISSVNQIEFIKKAIQQSAIYSTYQEVYTAMKYGTYGDYYGGCNPGSFASLPNDFPYWRNGDGVCFTNPANDIETKLESSITARFMEYSDAIKSQYGVTMPEYPNAEVKITDNLLILYMPPIGRLKFASDRLEISDNAAVNKLIQMPVLQMIDFAIENFVGKDSIGEKLEQAEQDMSSIEYDCVYPGFEMDNECYQYGSKHVQQPCETCEKTPAKRQTEYRNCKSIVDFKQCGSDPSADQVIGAYCPGVNGHFNGKIIGRIDELDNGLDSKSINTNLYVRNIESKTAGQCGEATVTQNSNLCSCVKWSCMGDAPVKFGSTDEKEIPFSTPVSIDEQSQNICSPCAEMISQENGLPDKCVPYKEKACAIGYTKFDDGCIKISNRPCPSGERYEPLIGECVDISCWDSDPECNADPDSCFHCGKGAPTSSCSGEYPFEYENDGTKCRTPVSPKRCADGFVEYENTGRCYKAPVAPSCSEREPLYTKSCTYDYSANANVLVNIRSDSLYPVYDDADGKTNLRNLELNFYVLGKSKDST